MQKINLNLLKYKNPNTGEFENLHTLVGKSAYEYALDGGYEGTEQEFVVLLANIATKEYVDTLLGDIESALDSILGV